MIEDFRPVNDLLRNLPVVESAGEIIRVDTFHTPYIQLNRKFAWPSIHMDQIHADEAVKIVEVLRKAIPEFVKGCSVLPEARPKKDSNQLHLVRPYEIENRKYLYVLRIVAQYMGGAAPQEVLSEGSQGITPSIQTDRIYYFARVMPVESWKLAGEDIVDYSALQSSDAIFHFTTRDTARDIFSTILFDEVDYSHINQKITDLFAFGEKWKPGKLFHPFVVDNLSICLNLLRPLKDETDIIVRYFDRAYRIIKDAASPDLLSAGDRDFWVRYYSSWDYERDASRAGNPHWKFTRFPDIENYREKGKDQ